MATRSVRRFGFGVLLAVALAGCGSSGGSEAKGTSPTSGTGPSTTASTSTTAPASEPSTSSELAPEDDVTRLQFRPVLGIGAPIDATTTSAVDGERSGPIEVQTADGLTYSLGPIAFDGTALTSAAAVLNETWVVEVRVTDDSVRTANEAFNACFDAEPTCPSLDVSGRGAIGIVLGDELASAPQVNGKDLASDAFVISGDFDQAEAERIADLING